MNKNLKIPLAAFVALMVGIGIGYYAWDGSGYDEGYAKGNETGLVAGRNNLLAEQKKEAEEEAQKAAEAANPFADLEEAANPFGDTFTNPFAQ